MKRTFSLPTGLVRTTLWIAAALSLCAPLPGRAQGQTQTDGLSTSAEYIAGFVRYVHWQDEERLDAWNICIVGNLPSEQDRAYANRVVRGKPFKVRRIDAEASFADCQVLDLTALNTAAANRLLERARRLPILAVGSGSEFCSSGGQICLHLGNHRPVDQQKFEVNISAMRDAALGVSSRLLTLGSSRTAAADGP